MLELRLATQEDCDLLFKWANDVECRKNSFSEDLIEYETHVRWLAKKILDEACDLFVAMDGEVPVGMLRLDYEKECAMISYSVAKEKRKHGYGKRMLQLAENFVTKEKLQICKMIGQVKKDNLGSQKAFEYMQYQKKEYENYFLYCKDIRNRER